MILDENLIGYTRSTTLPEPMHYRLSDTNPILYILADQSSHDGDFPEEITHDDILDGIIEGLQNETVEWPEDKNLLPMDEWIDNMKIKPQFYKNISYDALDFQAFDHQLIQVCANYLKRPINLISFPEGEPQIFIPESRRTSANPLNILSCNTVFKDSFAVSIFKNPEEKSSGSFFQSMKTKAKSLFTK